MNFFLQPLTLLTFFPLLGVLVLFFIPSTNKNALRWTALVMSLITLVISIWVLMMFNASNPDLQLEARYNCFALPSAAGTSGPSMSTTMLSTPSAAAAAIRCSTVRTRTPKAPTVVAELVSTT